MSAMVNVQQWLSALGLEQYAQAFADNDINSTLLPELNADDLKELGVRSLGHRKQLLKAIAELGGAEQGQILADAERTHKATQAASAERRQLTVMFCDLVGSTALSSRYDPEDLSTVIRDYQNTCVGIISRYEGYIAKFMGDGILIYFGYPKAHEDDAERSLRSGLEIIQAVSELKPQADLILQTRIGVATGLVVVGETIGEASAEEHTIVGETPNLAARLQALAEPDSLIISDATYRLTGELFNYQDLGKHQLKGFEQSIAAYQVLNERQIDSRFDAQRAARLLPMQGRTQELGQLLAHWQQTQQGKGQVLVLSGEAGIGKSRIVRALTDTIAQERHTRINYQCSPYHSDSALYPVIQQLNASIGITNQQTNEQKLDKLEAWLAELFDDINDIALLWAELLSLESADRYREFDLTPQQKRNRTLKNLVAAIQSISQHQPLLLVLEDAHWIDPTTLEWIELSLDTVASAPIMLLITARPEFDHTFGGHPLLARLTLNRLNHEPVKAIIQKVTNGKSLPVEVIDEIIKKTDGVPLFVEELTKTVIESGDLLETDDAYVLKTNQHNIQIPSSLHDSLLARLDRLQPVKEVAQTAACIGREFSYELLSAVVQIDDDELQKTLDQLIEAELVFRRGSPPEVIYTFKHALVRDTAYESLLRSRRQKIHAGIAKLLEDRFRDVVKNDPELLAYHYTESKLIEKAVPYWKKTGDNAVQRSAYKEAKEFLERGLNLLEKSTIPIFDRDKLELDILVVLGPVVMAMQSIAASEVGRVYNKAYDLCIKVKETPHWLSSLQGLRVFYVARGSILKGIEISKRMLQISEGELDARKSIDAYHSLGVTYFHKGDFRLARENLEFGLEHVKSRAYEKNDIRSRNVMPISCLVYQSLSCWFLGFPQKALMSSNAAVKAAKNSNHLYTLTEALLMRATLLQFRRESRPALNQAQKANKIAFEHGFLTYEKFAEIRAIWARSRLSSDEIRIEPILAVMAELKKTGILLLRPLYFIILGDLSLQQEKHEEGIIFADKGLEEVAKTQQGAWKAELLRLKGELLMHCMQRNSAPEDCFLESIDAARIQNAKSWELRTATSLARLWQEQGKQEDAYNLLAPVYNWFTEGFDTADLKDAKSLLQDLKSG